MLHADELQPDFILISFYANRSEIVSTYCVIRKYFVTLRGEMFFDAYVKKRGQSVKRRSRIFLKNSSYALPPLFPNKYQ